MTHPTAKQRLARALRPLAQRFTRLFVVLLIADLSAIAFVLLMYWAAPQEARAGLIPVESFMGVTYTRPWVPELEGAVRVATVLLIACAVFFAWLYYAPRKAKK